VSFVAINRVASQRVFIVVISFSTQSETFGYTLVHLHGVVLSRGHALYPTSI
jgi:hypothetical protein